MRADCRAPGSQRGRGGEADRAALIAQAFRLEWFTIAWMTVEAVGTIAPGVAAQSIGLTAFGIDSLIALASGE